MVFQQKIEQNLDLLARVWNMEGFIGNTPLFPIKKAYSKKGIQLFAKLEWQQLGSSVKARPAFGIFKNAVQQGKVNKSRGLLDATSGNTGIAYATIGAALGIPVTLCLPENASPERKLILKSLGVNIIYTSRFESTDGAQERALELALEQPDLYYYADQYANDNNWKAHLETTALEIWKQTKGRITHFITGLGTTGTFTGTTKGLKKLNSEIEAISLQPNIAMHGLEGWKHLPTAKVPKIYDSSLADSQAEVDTEEAFFWIKKVAETEGLLISPSAAANLAGAINLAEKLDTGTIVTMFPDNADKYGEVLKYIF